MPPNRDALIALKAGFKRQSIYSISLASSFRFSYRNPMFIYKEKAGVISESACWVCFHGCYMYSHDTLIGLIKDMWKHWNSDLRLIG